MIPVFSLGQELQFTFEDQDLTNWYQSSGSHWAIVSENPVSGEYSLSHIFDSEKDNTDWITLFHWPLEIVKNSTTWLFSLRYNYHPSSNNNWAIMLGTDCLPDNNLLVEKALILGVNYSGSDDMLKLWTKNEDELNLIINTGFNWEENIVKKKE